MKIMEASVTFAGKLTICLSQQQVLYYVYFQQKRYKFLLF